MVREGLAPEGLTPAELAGLRGNDKRKAAIAQAVWEETTVSMGWIAERLEMRSAADVSQILKREKARGSEEIRRGRGSQRSLK